MGTETTTNSMKTEVTWIGITITKLGETSEILFGENERCMMITTENTATGTPVTKVSVLAQQFIIVV